MRNILKLMAVACMAVIALAACGGGNDDVSNEHEGADYDDQATEVSGDKIQAITAFTLLEDMVKEIGRDKIEVHNLVPTGTDPHEYEPLPEDIKAATDADVLFYNGLNLEGGKNGWFGKMMDATGQDWDNAYELTEGVEPEYVVSGDGRDEEINPHAFLDPHVGIKMAENTIDALIE